MSTLYTEQKKYSDFLFVSRSILPSVHATKIWGSCHNFKCFKLVLKGPRLKLFARLKLSAPTVSRRGYKGGAKGRRESKEEPKGEKTKENCAMYICNHIVCAME